MDRNEIADAWGNESDEDGNISEELLGDFYFFLDELFNRNADKTAWVFMYLQIYSWQYQSFYEGVITYYENLYKNDTADGIRKLSDCLHQCGYKEVAKWYDYGIFDFELYPDGVYLTEQYIREREIDTWIQEHREDIWQIYLDLLLGHKEEMFQRVMGQEKSCEDINDSDSVQSANQPDSTRMSALADGTKQGMKFNSYINLSTLKAKNCNSWINDLTDSQIDNEMVFRIAAAKEVNRIQTTEYFPKETLQILNDKVFALREDITFRIYGMDSMENCNLQHFSCINQIQRLKIDCMRDVEHVEILSQFGNLKSLCMELEEREDYSFVNNLSKGLLELSLCMGKETEEFIFPMEWMMRFPKLQKCYIGNYKKHLELVTRKDGVRELVLFEMSCPELEVLQKLNIQKIVIHQEYTEGLEILGQLSDLKEIELLKIANLKNLDFLDKLPRLQKVTLRSLPNITRLPQFPKGHGLLEIAVYDCEKLSELSALGRLEHLQRLCLYSVGVSEKAVKDVVQNSAVEIKYY